MSRNKPTYCTAALLMLFCTACGIVKPLAAEGLHVTNGDVTLSVGMSREEIEAITGFSMEDGWAWSLEDGNALVRVTGDTVSGISFGGECDWRTRGGVLIGMSEAELTKLLGEPDERNEHVSPVGEVEMCTMRYNTSDKLSITLDRDGNAIGINVFSGDGETLGMAFHLASGDKSETLENIRIGTNNDMTGFLLQRGIVKLTYDGTGEFRVTTNSGNQTIVLVDSDGSCESSFPAEILDSFDFAIIAENGNWDIRIYSPYTDLDAQV